MAYATKEDLTTFLGARMPTTSVVSDDELTRILDRASELIDDNIRTAFYPTDDEIQPTDDDTLTALCNATCAQIEFWQVGNEEDDILGPLASITAGGTTEREAKPGMVLAPRAARILLAAHLFSMEPLTL